MNGGVLQSCSQVLYPRYLNSEWLFLFTADLVTLTPPSPAVKWKKDGENTWNLGIYLKKPKDVALIFAEESL